MPTTSLSLTETPLLAGILRRADDALILGHRLSEWCGHAPMLEEDIALANIALDCVGQARSFYTYAAEVAGEGLTEDDFAYRREAGQYRNCLLVEQRKRPTSLIQFPRRLFNVLGQLFTMRPDC